MFDSKGQSGETITWMIATLIIIVALVISISVVQFTLKEKTFATSSSNLLVTKSLAGYLMSDDGKGVVFGQLKSKINPIRNRNSFDNFNRNFTRNLFFGIYGKSYPDYLWVGVLFNDLNYDVDASLISKKENLLGVSTATSEIVVGEIYLDKDKRIKLEGVKR